jgi:hypothetical protein
MGDGVRFDFINYSATDVKVEVTTSDAIVYQELLASTPQDLPGGNLQNVAAGTHTLTVSAGRLFGFSSDAPASITSVSGKVTILVAGGKDPWPQPPPPPPLKLAAATSWADRFKNFNFAGGVGNEAGAGRGVPSRQAGPDAWSSGQNDVPRAEQP